MSKIKKRLIGSIVTLALQVVSTLTAYAGIGNISYATVNDIEYYFYSSSYTNGLSAWGFTEVGTVSKGNVPGGWGFCLNYIIRMLILS